MLLSLFQTIIKPIFGTFEREELKKFLRMGVTFALIIGSYWTMRVLKKVLFLKLIGPGPVRWAKLVSIVVLFPALIIYTKLIEKYPAKKVFSILAVGYGIMLATFGTLFYFYQLPEAILAQQVGMAKLGTNVLGFSWYVFVESFGSLVVALFWAIAASITSPDSAKKGFSLIYAIGQVGGILMPYGISQLPTLFNIETDWIQVASLSIFVFALIFTMKWFFSATPKELLTHAYHATDEKKVEAEQEPGFFEGLRILISSNYLLGIFFVISFFEVIVTVFDWNFDVIAHASLHGQALSQYLAAYGSYVNAATLVCLLLGVSNITRYLGVPVALALVPLAIGGAITGFLTYGTLAFFFWLMVGSKALGYALQGPALKQLYIPLSHDARFKSQAWIETFGSRLSKASGEGLNLLLTPIAAGMMGYGIVAIWLFIALFLGKTYNKAIKDNKLVC